MANLIWTGILYFSTLSIVYVAYRTFMNDRRLENELRTANQIRIAQGLGRKTMTEMSAAVAAAAPSAAPGIAAAGGGPRFVAPGRGARSNTIPGNIRRA